MDSTNQLGHSLLTPLYVKTDDEAPWPDDAVFYLLTADGLFLCRNHPFFRSSVRAPRWPSELAWHTQLLEPRYPKISQEAIEKVVGFFDHVADLYSSEAVVLVVWNRATEEVEIIAPPQLATVSRNRWGDTYPIGVEYDAPAFAPDQVLLGDIHSHVDMSAYASGVDRDDERHRAGLHVVVGRLYQEPPDVHIEAVVDGARFELKPSAVFTDYKRRRKTFPRDWVQQIKLKVYGSGATQTSTGSASRYSTSNSSYTGSSRNDDYASQGQAAPAGYKVPALAPKDDDQKPSDEQGSNDNAGVRCTDFKIAANKPSADVTDPGRGNFEICTPDPTVNPAGSNEERNGDEQNDDSNRKAASQCDEAPG